MLLSAIFVAACVVALKAIYRDEWLLAFPVYLMLLYILMIFVGVNQLFLDDIAWVRGYGLSVNSWLVFVVWGFPIVYCAVLFMLSRGRPRLRDFPSGSVKSCGQSVIVSCVFVLAVGAFLFALYWARMGVLPIVGAVLGSDEPTSQLREASTMLFGGLGRRMWLVFCRYMLPLVTLVLYLNRLARRNKRRSSLLVLSLVLTLLVLVADTQKAQVVFFAFQLLVARGVYRWVTSSERTTSRRLVTYCLGMVAITVVLYLGTMDVMQGGGTLGQKLEYAFGAILRRMTITQALPLVVIFDDFPGRIPFLLGSTLPTWGLLPRTQFDLSEYCSWRLYGASGGAASTLFLGEAYANLGVGGVVVFALLSAFAIGVLHRRLGAACVTVEGIAAYAFLSGYIIRLSITQVFMGLGLPVLTLVAFRIICGLTRAFLFAASTRAVGGMVVGPGR